MFYQRVKEEKEPSQEALNYIIIILIIYNLAGPPIIIMITSVTPLTFQN